jgi:hypothetical protein
VPLPSLYGSTNDLLVAFGIWRWHEPMPALVADEASGCNVGTTVASSIAPSIQVLCGALKWFRSPKGEVVSGHELGGVFVPGRGGAVEAKSFLGMVSIAAAFLW